MTEPIEVPIPIPIKVRPVWAIVKWWRMMNIIGKAWKTAQKGELIEEKIKEEEGETYVHRVNRKQSKCKR